MIFRKKTPRPPLKNQGQNYRSLVLKMCVVRRLPQDIFFIFYYTSAAQQKTFCNPINIDYDYTPIPNFSEQGRLRATADPVIALFKNNYFLPISRVIGTAATCLTGNNAIGYTIYFGEA